MKYSAFGWLLLVTILTIQCSPSLMETVEPGETPGALPSVVQTPTLPPTGSPIDTSTPPAPESAETPVPSPTPTPSSTPPAVETVTPASNPSQDPAEGDTQLKMVLIRAKSPLEVEKLRRMGLNLIRVREVESKETSEVTPDSKQAFLEQEFLIEAVVSPGILAKLKGLGFEVTEVP